MRLVRRADLTPRPWKNGGGVTREIAAHPPEAGLDGFDWRLSMADVASDGPFSAFPGIDRTLTVIEGAGARSRPFRWAQVAADDVAVVALAAGLVVHSLHELAGSGRWAAVLEDPS